MPKDTIRISLRGLSKDELLKKESVLLLKVNEISEKIESLNSFKKEYEEFKKIMPDINAKVKSLDNVKIEMKSSNDDIVKNEQLQLAIQLKDAKNEQESKARYLVANLDEYNEVEDNISTFQSEYQFVQLELLDYQEELASRALKNISPLTLPAEKNNNMNLSIRHTSVPIVCLDAFIVTLKETLKDKFIYEQVSKDEHRFTAKDNNMEVTIDHMGVRGKLPTDPVKQGDAIDTFIDVYIEKMKGTNVPNHIIQGPDKDTISKAELKLAIRLLADNPKCNATINGKSCQSLQSLDEANKKIEPENNEIPAPSMGPRKR